MSTTSNPVAVRRASPARPRSKATVDRIMRAAAEEFCTRGLLGGSIEKISRSARTTKQLVYYYFKSKEQLYTAVLDEVSARSAEDLLPGHYDEVDPIEALSDFVQGLFDQHVSRPTLAGLVLDQNLHQCAHMTHRNKFTSQSTLVIETLASILRRGVVAGVFRADVRADYLFATIYMLTSGYFINPLAVSIAFPEPGHHAPEQIAAWRIHSVEFILNSIRPMIPPGMAT